MHKQDYKVLLKKVIRFQQPNLGVKIEINQNVKMDNKPKC